MIAGAKDIIGAGWALAVRNIQLQIREHALGYAWTLIIPVLYAICYIFIKRELAGGAVRGPDANWDVLRAFAGITLFQCWMQLVQEMSEMIRRQRGMLRGLSIGPTPFVLAVALEGIVAIAVRAALIIIAMPLLGLELPHSWLAPLWFLACLAVIHFSAIAIGLILSPWAALYSDVRKALRALNLPLVLISPIFYPAVERSNSILYWINMVNPLASPLAVLTDILHGKVSSYYSIPMLAWGVVALLLATWSIGQLRRQVPILLERLGS